MTPGQTLSGNTPPSAESWPLLCRLLNGPCSDSEGWWRRFAEDPEAVFRIEENSVVVRLRGNFFAEIWVYNDSLRCRMDPAHLLPLHPGMRVVLGDDASSGTKSVRTLAELSKHYDRVRRRACSSIDRRAAILDRLFLRHSCVLAVDAPLPCGRADMVVLSPGGEAVFFLLRRYADPDLRLKGHGGLVWRMNELDRWLADASLVADWTERLIRRSAALVTPQVRRYGFRGTISPLARSRLLLVDFDHAQRLGGLPRLRGELEAGLDRTSRADDILAIGDPGNITHRILFSGL